MYFLDTNIISFLQKGNTNVITKISATLPSNLHLCSITVAELLFGAISNPNNDRGQMQKKYYLELFNNTEIFDFDFAAAIKFAELKSTLQQTGSIIEDFDLQIASIALTNNLILVTNNTKDFLRVPNLQLEDWSN